MPLPKATDGVEGAAASRRRRGLPWVFCTGRDIPTWAGRAQIPCSEVGRDESVWLDVVGMGLE